MIEKIRNQQIAAIKKTVQIYGHILATVSQEAASTLRDQNDAPNGWSALEVLCHVRDFDGFFYGRAVMIRNEANPQLPAYDHEALAIERRYNQQNLKQVYAELVESRQRFVEFFQSLTDDEWERAGIHPESGHFSLMDALMQVSSHDLTHLEQLTRILYAHSHPAIG